jgi:hypothetical protein
MGIFLLHHPLVQFYLLFVAALFIAFIWDYLRNPPAIPDSSRTPRNEIAHGAPGVFRSAANQKRPQSVARPGQRTDKKMKLIRGERRLHTPTDPIPAPSSRNRRVYHVVTP